MGPYGQPSRRDGAYYPAGYDLGMRIARALRATAVHATLPGRLSAWSSGPLVLIDDAGVTIRAGGGTMVLPLGGVPTWIGMDPATVEAIDAATDGLVSWARAEHKRAGHQAASPSSLRTPTQVRTLRVRS